ncbi:glycoside hydrolase family 3 N-terminal domain-containing protein [Paenibacillus sp. HB172176]|uniref:glycoside hydrolase family 3 N-terminal domain-containing protein n=1 Tax=Paenibacillus sp. HB172176 TaxID=2493690 RepID=UPI00143A2516|nr:glycoside hydrolase family 3 N-terminal domain-containing protein [Paenibacillus sp. HB172176]
MVVGYKNPELTVEERVEDLLGRMTLKEKAGQLNQHMYGWDAYARTGEEIALTDKFKEQVAFGEGMGALYGLFRADPWSAVTHDNGIPTRLNGRIANEIQRYVRENTRLGIPVLLSEECPHGHQALDSTLLPVNLAVGSTWNPELAERAYSHVAAEIRGRGGHLGLVSALDMLLEPRWGRAEECYSEDPYLTASFAQAVVRGLQGERAEELKSGGKVAAILKHLCAQGAGQGGHNAGPASIGERELREVHLPAALAGVEAGALGVMAAYNEIDGVPCHANSYLLEGILRKEWKFDGIVMADGCAIDRLTALGGDYPSAAALALSAGVDLSLWDKSFTMLEEAVERGLASMEDIDRSVRRVLALKFRLGLFDQPYVDESLSASAVGTEESRALNLQLARESAVLLRNVGGILPLGGAGLRDDGQSRGGDVPLSGVQSQGGEETLSNGPSQGGDVPLSGNRPQDGKPSSAGLKRIAVIGPNADRLYNQLGDYTSVQLPGSGITVLQGIRELAPDGTEVVYARGCGIRDMRETGLDEAVEAARSSEVAVLVLGGSSAREFGEQFDSNGAIIWDENASSEMDAGEGVDLADLRLGGLQEELVERIAATGTPIVAVVIQGRPHALTAIEPHCDAMLCAWYPGPEGGRAIAELLFGHANPSGKLSVSLPRSSAQLPVYYHQKNQGRRRPYVDMSELPLYGFGYGLSYTEFDCELESLTATSITAASLDAGETVRVSIGVSNIGERAGATTIQLYIQASGSPITRRVRELKGFRKLELQPGEKKSVVLELGREQLAIWNREMKFAVEPCEVTLFVGLDSHAPEAAKLAITR